MKSVYTLQRKKIEDSRGWFLKVIDGNEDNNPFPCEVYITSAKPGESKGGHYHIKAKEWFTVIKGEAQVKLIDIDTNEQSTVILSDERPTSLFVPEKVAHLFMNISNQNELIILAYSNIRYDKSDTVPVQF